MAARLVAVPQILRQRTIRQPVHAIGIGVHSANKVRITLRPAGENTGITFLRSDLSAARIAAQVNNVSDTTLSTTLSSEGVQVATVEHLMSALWGTGVDNVIVELTAEEVPIMDGSSEPFVDLIRMAGVMEQPAAKQFLRIRRPVRVSQGDAWAALEPWHGFNVQYTFQADHPVYNQHPKNASIDFCRTSYITEVCRARSFGLVAELPQAHAINRCLGSSLDNAVGIDDTHILNPDGLRYPDEFVKHKILDAIGDLYLLGHSLIGAFSGYKSGHALNNRLLRKLLEAEHAWQRETFDDVGEAPISYVQPIEAYS